MMHDEQLTVLRLHLISPSLTLNHLTTVHRFSPMPLRFSNIDSGKQVAVQRCLAGTL